MANIQLTTVRPLQLERDSVVLVCFSLRNCDPIRCSHRDIIHWVLLWERERGEGSKGREGGEGGRGGREEREGRERRGTREVRGWCVSALGKLVISENETRGLVCEQIEPVLYGG